ncbi:MAG: FAD-dependent oxidoreductase [Planctomycetales bacterium]|nr:FAD-dependent oxidoreductase [Planctomycetales bacterium]
MKVCIIGAGPAGLTAAYELAKQGAEVEVFEASGETGGMSRSFQLWDQTVDLGPHRFFSSDARVNRLWLDVVGSDYQMVDRLTRIRYNNRFFRYPLEPLNALGNLGVFKAAACIFSYLRERLSPSCADDHTFESWVVRRFGRRLFETFFKSYSEKLWGISCRELDSDFAAQRIKKLSLGEVIRNGLGIGALKHRTLVDQFAYPVGGTGMVYERMAEFIDAVGELHLNCPVRRVLTTDGRAHGLELVDGTRRECDHIISTMPLNLLIKGLEGVPEAVSRAAGSLRFRNTILAYLHVAGSDLFPDQWVYVHDPSLKVGRITNFRNWTPDLYGDSPNTIVALEYWCNEPDAAWRTADEELIEMAKREFRQSGLLGSSEILDGAIVRVPKSYPVYTRGYQEHLNVIVDYLRQIEGLTPIGRYGAFKYNNQDHSILMGLMAADQILSQHGCDLWAVNTDYEAYQEEATITAAGLVTSELVAS